jgi:hypothetical protein
LSKTRGHVTSPRIGQAVSDVSGCGSAWDADDDLGCGERGASRCAAALLDLPVELVLPTHGDPAGCAALERALS